MKTNTTHIRILFLLSPLITGLSLLAPGRVAAQSGLMINSDGAFPAAGLVLSGGTHYGTPQRRGSSANGAVLASTPGETVLLRMHSFAGPDGMRPYAILAPS